MQPKTSFHFLACALVWLGIFAQSCRSNTGVYKNGQISTGKRADFHEMNDQAFTDIRLNDVNHLKLLLSKELIAEQPVKTLELIANQLTDHKFTLLDEYYVVNKYRDRDTIQPVGQGINQYSLNYGSEAEEMYFAFYVPGDKAVQNKFMISLLYAKYNYGWKIFSLDEAPYTINGETAPELYKMAKEQFSKNHLVSAVNTLSLATTCLRPAEIWQYTDEDSIAKLNADVIEKANAQYKFPVTVNALATKPQIIKVYNQNTPEGSFPVIYYLSKINLKDTAAIKTENMQLRKAIGKLMPGLDEDSRYIYYSAFNQRPGRKTVDHFDMTDKLK